MRSIILILSILLSLIYLKGNSQNDNVEIREQLDNFLIINDSLKEICDEISLLKKLNLNPRNPENSDSFDSKLYKRFINNSVGYEQYALTYHESPMVKIFAYFRLNERYKVLLMTAIRENKNDTSKVSFSYGPYYDEIYGSRIQVNQLVIWLAYWGYLSQPAITLDSKDWKYIQKKYFKVKNYWGKEFIEHHVSMKGKAANRPQGATIQLENGNYYFIENKSIWENEVIGKEISITGNIKLYKSNIFRRIRFYRKKYVKYLPSQPTIPRQGSWIEFYKMIDASEIVIIEKK